MKKFILAIGSLVALVTLSNARLPTWQWHTTASGPSFMQGTSVATDNIGGVYISGYYASQLNFGAETLNSADNGFESMFVAKYDTAGRFIWAQNVTGASQQINVAVDIYDNVYLSGDFNSPVLTIGTTVDTLVGSRDVFIARLDQYGNLTWLNIISGTKADFSSGLTIDSIGNVYIAGSTNDTALTIGNLILSSDTNYNMFIIKYDPDGNALWAKNAVTAGSARTAGISSDATYNVYVTGTYGGGPIILGADTLSAGQGFFIAKYDSSGNVIWAKSSIGGGTDGFGIACDAMGNSYIAGAFYTDSFILDGTILTSAVGNNNDNAFVAKFDTAGNLAWAKSTGGNGYNGDAVEKVNVDSRGYVYITGALSSPEINFGADTLKLTTTGANNAFVVKLDGAGNTVWAKTIGGNGFDFGLGLCVDPNFNVYLTGICSDTVIFDNDIVSVPAFNTAIFIARLDDPEELTGINNITQNRAVIDVFPNPSGNGNFYFKGVSSDCTMQVYDLLGNLVNTSTVTREPYLINLHGKAAGIYFYQLTDKSGMVQQGRIAIQ